MTDRGPPIAPSTANPFAPPAADPPAVRIRPVSWVAVLLFLVRSSLILLLLPGLFSVLGAMLGYPWWWAVLPATWFLHGPVWVLQVVDRFLAPVRDPTPITFANGLVMDRWRFRRLTRAVLAERIVLSILVGAVAVPILWSIVPVLVPFVVLAVLLLSWASYQNVRMSDSLVALVEEDYATVVERAGAVLAHPILNRALLPTAALHVGVGRLRQGDAPGAIEALERVPRWAMPQAHLTRAWLLATQGRVDDAKRALEGRLPTNLGERVASEYARAAISLEEGHAEAVLEQAKAWTDLRDGQPKAIREGFDLVEAGALAILGRTDDARALLDRTGAAAESRAWVEGTWPRLWAALKSIG